MFKIGDRVVHTVGVVTVDEVGTVVDVKPSDIGTVVVVASGYTQPEDWTVWVEWDESQMIASYRAGALRIVGACKPSE